MFDIEKLVHTPESSFCKSYYIHHLEEFYYTLYITYPRGETYRYQISDRDLSDLQVAYKACESIGKSFHAVLAEGKGVKISDG